MWCGCFVLISKLCSWVQSAFSAIRVQQSHDDRESTTLSCDGSLFIRLPTSFSVRWCFVRFTCTQVFGGSMEPLLVTAGTDYDFERLWVENILANVQGLNKVWCWICGTQLRLVHTTLQICCDLWRMVVFLKGDMKFSISCNATIHCKFAMTND